VLVRSESGDIISLVNINQASLESLISLPGIGPVTAEKIIEYREKQVFTRIEDIQKVPGIGPATFEDIKPYLTVGE
jgi:competence protein ComEA